MSTYSWDYTEDTLIFLKWGNTVIVTCWAFRDYYPDFEEIT